MNITRQCLLCITLTVCFVVLIAAEATQSDKNNASDDHDDLQWPQVVPAQLTPRAVHRVRTAIRVSAMEAMIRQFQSLPLHVRLSEYDYLIDELLNDDVVEMDFYEWEPGSRDLRHVSVRAAWFLEELLGIELPMIAEQPTAADRALAHQNARMAFDAYRRGMLDMIDEYRIGESRGAMLRRYQHLIEKDAPENPGWAFWRHSLEPFEAMLKAWFPLEKSFADLEFIVGRKAGIVIDTLEVAPEGTDIYIYQFGNGGAAEPPKYYFFVKDGIITHVFRRPS